MVGLIIHFCGVVTGFAFQSWGDFFVKKQQVVTGCVLSMHSVEEISTSRIHDGPYHSSLWRCRWACF